VFILGGIGYQHRWEWGDTVVLGYWGCRLVDPHNPTISITFAIDCYKLISGAIMVVAMVCKNYIAYLYSHWVFDLAMGSNNECVDL
jgi:hypothetical protein